MRYLLFLQEWTIGFSTNVIDNVGENAHVLLRGRSRKLEFCERSEKAKKHHGEIFHLENLFAHLILENGLTGGGIVVSI